MDANTEETMSESEAIEEIIGRHMQALLDELYEQGIDAAGVAGGVVLAAGGTGPNCHVFASIQPTIGIRGEDGQVSQEGLVPRFLDDVANAMARSAAEGKL